MPLYVISIIIATAIILEAILRSRRRKKAPPAEETKPVEAPQYTAQKLPEQIKFPEIPQGMNPLPDNTDWNEINAFLLSEIEESSSTEAKNRLSDASKEVLRCLDNDIYWVFGNLSAGSVSEELSIMRDYFELKYKGITPKYLNRIYHKYGVQNR